jgi:hypothetical protein
LAGRWAARAPAEIAADPAGEPASAAAWGRIQGAWRVEGQAARVRIEGARLVVDAPGIHAERAIEVTSAKGETLEATLRSPTSAEHVTVQIEAHRLVVRGEGLTVVLVSSPDPGAP